MVARKPNKDEPTLNGSYIAPSRNGKLHLSAWLSPDYKSSMRAIQAKDPSRSLQDLYAEALNDLFRKHDVPIVNEVSKKLKTPAPRI